MAKGKFDMSEFLRPERCPNRTPDASRSFISRSTS